jgi:hypothetical protein
MSDHDRPHGQRLGRPPIEPLSDVAWARIERAVLAELSDDPRAEPVVAGPRRPRWHLALVAAAGIALAGIALAVWPRGHGGTRVAREAGAFDAAPGEQLPSRVATGASPAELSFGDAHVAVAPTSTLVLTGSSERGVTAVLERGGAQFTVAPRAGRPPFVVQAGATTIRVVGTRFEVLRSASDVVDLTVSEGVVQVVHRGQHAEVRAGGRWSSTGLPGETATATAAETVTGPTGPAPDLADEPASTTRRQDHATPTPTPAPAPSQSERAAAERADQAVYEQAAGLEARDPARAGQLYRRLAMREGRWAPLALFALGRLAHDRGDHAAARSTLELYLRRHPRGDNAADARALLTNLPQGAP